MIAILGCTATGKSQAALCAAARTGGEIVSVDSMKVYRGMDIGTAKPSAQVRARVPHHLIDVVDPWDSFSVSRFLELADAAVEAIHRRGRPAVVVGGTLLYFQCFYRGLFAAPPSDPRLREQLRRRADALGRNALHAELAAVDPDAAARIHRNDLRRLVRALEVYQLTGTPISRLQREWNTPAPRRADWRWTLVGLRRPAAAVNRRINQRVRLMIEQGLVAEARRLWEAPRGLSQQARCAVGYAELFEHFEGRATLDEAIERIKVHTRQLARRQRTWLRRFDGLRWVEQEDEDDASALIQALGV